MNNQNSQRLKIPFRIHLVALRLVAVLLAYLAFRSPGAPSPERQAVVGKAAAEYEAEAQAIEATKSADGAVHAIAEGYAPQIAEVERQRDELKIGTEQYFKGGTLDKESE
ncbi:MAG: hypothetical protein M2R45_04473 [Verrucomicrobia subdivision 3 bacterium]|nr:hypothetical protein [Limisphaerales bacterium]MCS1412684.1 hypothetical protein [Limisphaerales bacterium]